MSETFDTARRILTIRICNFIADRFCRLAAFFEDCEHHWRRCVNCGENIWFGKPCFNDRSNGDYDVAHLPHGRQ